MYRIVFENHKLTTGLSEFIVPNSMWSHFFYNLQNL